MKSIKKRIAGLLAATLMTTMMPMSTFAIDYSSHWAKSSIERWVGAGLISGYEDGTFKPKQAITRAELAAFIVRVKGLTKTDERIKFLDVASEAWYASDVAKVSAAGIMHIEGEQFNPNQAATREEAAYAIARAYHVESSKELSCVDAENVSDWAQAAVSGLYEKGFIAGRPDNTFAPKDTLTRADLVVMLDKITGKVINSAGTYTNDIQGNLVINSPNVVLKDMVIKGNLYLAEGIGEGDVTLENVIVEGATYVEGGGENSIHLNNSTLVNILVNKATGTVRIVAQGETTVQQVEIQSSAILAETGMTANGFTDVVVSNLVQKDANVTLTGSFETVEVLAHTIKLDIPSGVVDLLSVLASAIGTQITLGKDVTVENAEINSAVTLDGLGTIKNVLVDSNDVELNANVTNLSVSDGITSPTNSNNTNSTSSNNSSSNNSSNKSDEVSNFSFKATPIYEGKVKLAFNTDQEIIYNTQDATNNNIAVELVIGNQSVNIAAAEYNAASKILSLDTEELFVEENIGKLFTVKVTGSKNLVGTYTQSVSLYGFTGRVYDTTNQGVSNVEISFRVGINNTDGAIVATAITDENGQYGIFVQPGVYTGTMAKPGYMSSNRIVATSATNTFNFNESAVFIAVPLEGEMRTVLTWGMKPSDLDSHLYVQLGNNESYHTWYGDTKAFKTTGSGIYADLDWDDVTSYGPETTTIRDLQPGRYAFYVHNFSGEVDMGVSQAKVEVYGTSAEPQNVFYMPQQQLNKIYWHVYDMVVDQSGGVTITEVNQLVDTVDNEDIVVDSDDPSYIIPSAAYSRDFISKIYLAATTGSAVQTTGSAVQTTGSAYIVDLDSDYTECINTTDSIYQQYVQVDEGSYLAVKFRDQTVINKRIDVRHDVSDTPIISIADELESVKATKNEEYLFLPLSNSRYEVFELEIEGIKRYLYICRGN